MLTLSCSRKLQSCHFEVLKFGVMLDWLLYKEGLLSQVSKIYLFSEPRLFRVPSIITSFSGELIFAEAESSGRTTQLKSPPFPPQNLFGGVAGHAFIEGPNLLGGGGGGWGAPILKTVHQGI